ncbi:hypothetical protein PG2049B_1659 [Bifidobacterium pseudolongum subsp. globosum]|uniref:XRE family transcriptional regulator n=1 Tax=Bifidobacterium pseudolongum subsp. globosum TaxID=1690 RepID=A0A4Q5AH95_9BIFI|nr:XRE family transcriptional regulator [Bifidobacterium pseudolongum]RYQ21023.1 hypothetical protein PG2049B_1659 [Bifidobacterium pseudolongum subsp. globosum]RYQ29434.1 hypothetical protein PG2017B_1623 [Bifidobacterium pseudolongum subsp. globosum]
MHTTLDLSQYDDVTVYDDAPRRPKIHVDYLPTPSAVARRVREVIDDRHLSMEQLASDAHVDVHAVRSLYDRGLASLCDTRRVFAMLGIHVHAYPVEMVTMSL